MLRLSVLAVALASFNAAAARTLLDCNIPWGELQQVTVKLDGGKYVLGQLNNSGSWRNYPLPAAQWEQKKIALHLEWQGKAFLVKEGGGWAFTIPGADYYALGSCRH